MINQLIAILLPSLIGVKQCEKVFGEEHNRRRMIERYLKCVLYTNLATYIAIIYIFRNHDFVFMNEFTVQYILLALIITYVLPIIKKTLNENVSIKIKVEKNENNN